MTGVKWDRANFTNSDLTLADLLGASFVASDLSGVCLFEAKHYGWKISGVICSHFYLDGDKRERIPTNRDLETGEFEELFSTLDTEHDAIMKALHRGRQRRAQQ